MDLRANLHSTGIEEGQLETWSRGGAQTTAKTTYQSVKTALAAANFRDGNEPEVYLQGSYRNSTNIRGDSDVDIVAQLNSVYIADTSALNEAEKRRYEAARIPASYSFQEYRSDALDGLRDYYGYWAVNPKKKCIEIERDQSKNRLGADVVPCFQYRRYFQYTDGGANDYIVGMTFKPSGLLGGDWIVNYPKLHYAMGVEKNSAEETNGWYKPTIRMFKNARNRYNQGWFREVEAPSYFIAGLLSNVPSELFGDTYRDTYLQCLAWLARNLDDASRPYSMTCQNGVVSLFGTGPDQWTIAAAKRFVGAMLELWEES